MILTTKGECLQSMSTRGWALFCKHNIENNNGDPATWANDEEVTLNRVEVRQYEYSPSTSSNITGLWHEGKSTEDIEQAALSDSGSVIFNLMEDIFVLKEMLSYNQAQSSLSSILTFFIIISLKQILGFRCHGIPSVKSVLTHVAYN